MTAVPERHLLPLPRELEGDPLCDAIRARFAAADHRLWPGGERVVPLLPFERPLARALREAAGQDQLLLGLEAASAALANEAHGLAALAERGTAPQSARVSRLLLLSTDAAERLRRRVERLADTHADRLLVAVVTTDAVTLGHAITGRDVAVKVVLAQHKQAVAALLRASAA